MTELKVTGMTCGHCQAAVKSALESVAGVKSVDVDLGTGVARVEGEVVPGALVEAVEEEGYTASITSR